MTFFITPIFELFIYVFFALTALLAYKKHGLNVLLLFGMIIVIALSIEIPAISRQNYEYLKFMIYLANYPICLPLGWCLFFYWAHTFSESILKWTGTLPNALSLALVTGLLTGTMSLFIEPVGQALGWWIYHGAGASGIMWYGVPIEINLTYFVWGCFDATVFRLFMYKGWLKRIDVSPPILQHFPAFSSILVFTAMFIAVIGTPEIILILFFPNVLVWGIIYIVRFKNQYPLSLQKIAITG